MVRLTLARPRRRSFPLENSAARFTGHVPISRVLAHSSSSSFFHNQRERRRYLVMHVDTKITPVNCVTALMRSFLQRRRPTASKLCTYQVRSPGVLAEEKLPLPRFPDKTRVFRSFFLFKKFQVRKIFTLPTRCT